MELRHLKYFVMVARTLNFSDASRRLYITQGTLSQQIQQLEYKSLMQRAKDYIMSMAAVAIILLFLSFILLRIKSMRDMKKAADEAKKLREQQNSNIPTI